MSNPFIQSSNIGPMLQVVKGTPEYRAIADFYGQDRAKRSGVRLMNHIHEGVAVIACMGGGEDAVMAARAYCIHPLFQNDRELATVGQEFAKKTWPSLLVLYAMEYREKANAWLSDKVVKGEDGNLICIGQPDAGDDPVVRVMLCADKVQNYKDFIACHRGTHTRSDELDLYFKTWLEHLGISPELFEALCAAVERA